jgi:hypothetical protein
MYSLANICNLFMGAAMLSLGVWAYIRWDIFCCYTYVFSVVVLCLVGLSNQFLFLVESLLNENWQLVWCFSVQSKVQVLVFVEVLVCYVQHKFKFSWMNASWPENYVFYTCLFSFHCWCFGTESYGVIILCSDNEYKYSTVFAQILNAC